MSDIPLSYDLQFLSSIHFNLQVTPTDLPQTIPDDFLGDGAIFGRRQRV